MWRKHFNIFPSFVFKYVCIINNFFPGYEKYEFPHIYCLDKQLTVKDKPNIIAKNIIDSISPFTIALNGLVGIIL